MRGTSLEVKVLGIAYIFRRIPVSTGKKERNLCIDERGKVLYDCGCGNEIILNYPTRNYLTAKSFINEAK